MTQSTIDFLLNNNVTIIQVVFGIIFLLVVFVILRSFREDKARLAPPAPTTSKSRREEFQAEKIAEEKKASGEVPPNFPKEESPLDDIDNLDDLMGADATQSQIDETLSAAATPSAAMPQSAPAAAQNGELAMALSEKEKVISDLKNEINSLNEKSKSQPQGDTSGLEAKVKELSEKLSEYEIIEDDIANLSFYKSENTKLKNELEKLKGATGAAVDAALTAEATPPAAPIAPVVKESAPPSPPVPQVSDDSVLNEFEEAVKQKEALEKNIPIKEAPAPVAPNNDADLLKAFESAVDKEMEAAPNTKPAPPETTLEAAKAEEINSNKLVEEVEALAQAKPPEGQDDGKDSNQKLIEEFENFVNKN